MPTSSLRCAAGQASAEYVAVLALVALLLAGAGAASTAPAVLAAVAAKIRLALCLVGGDVCRSSDAATRGLEPCVVRAEEHSRETGGTVLFVRLANGRAYSVERRSDGSALVSASTRSRLDGTAGAGFRLGPYVKAGGDLSIGLDFRPGRAWELADAAALDRFMARIGDPYALTGHFAGFLSGIPEPTRTFSEGGVGLSGHLGLSVRKGKLRLPTLRPGELSQRQALGRREGPEGTTWYYDLGVRRSGAIGNLLPGIPPQGRELFEWLASDPPVATLRKVYPGNRRGETLEVVARLVLSRPADRAAALAHGLLHVGGPLGLLAGEDLERRMKARGTVEALVYREETAEDGWDHGLRLLARLEAHHKTTVTRRALVDAHVVNAPRPRRRADCLGF